MLENLLNVEEAYLALKEGYLIKSTNNIVFKMRNKKVWVKSDNATYTLNCDDFKNLYSENRFFILEDNDEIIDSKKDEEYYSFKHK